MATKIRLAQAGRKNKRFFKIIAADERAPRGGRFIEKLGTYNPQASPSQVVLNEAAVLRWLAKGAQPTPTARQLLSSQGTLLRRHLQQGVEKGALTQEIADEKFYSWYVAQAAKTQRRVALQKREIPAPLLTAAQPTEAKKETIKSKKK